MPSDGGDARIWRAPFGDGRQHGRHPWQRWHLTHRTPAPTSPHRQAGPWRISGCLGLNFTYMQAKCFVRHLLRNVAVLVAPGYTAGWRMWPIPQPKDGLRVTVSPVQGVPVKH